MVCQKTCARRAGHGGVPPGLREDLPEGGMELSYAGGAGVTGLRQKGGEHRLAPAWGVVVFPQIVVGLSVDVILSFMSPFGNSDE